MFLSEQIQGKEREGSNPWILSTFDLGPTPGAANILACSARCYYIETVTRYAVSSSTIY